ncbi:SOS response-associated peptidase [Rhodococcus rhodnii]|uniref:Abasic site processing protein n=1 Tax=Rhodococcus rhodnii TaxID=38312 RepID=A0A6P2CIX6_9NOCA|nr:SOS response-associated peptidase [Rhodococcus rhodnii]TXG92595.1 SOS response-associated peptidase [Rhodococcus rhodnii]
MCGRYVTGRDPALLAQDLEAIDDTAGSWDGPRWNVAPTTSVPVLASPRGERRIRMMRWGLVPQWADPAAGSVLFNARVETLLEKASFASAARRRRALVPMEAWYEWAGEGRDARPYAVRRPDAATFTVAGLWEYRRDPDAPGAPPLVSLAIVTTAASGALREIHPRMPLVVAPDHRAAWLDCSTGDVPADVPAAADSAARALAPYRVSRRVGSIRHDDPSLLEPLGTGDDGEAHEAGDQLTLL